MIKFNIRIRMLIGRVHMLKKKGLSRDEIRKDYRVNEILNQIYDRAWRTCEKADEVMKTIADS